MPRGTVTFVYSSNQTVIKWSDHCDVHAISTLYNNEMTRVKHQVDEESVDREELTSGIKSCVTTRWGGK